MITKAKIIWLFIKIGIVVTLIVTISCLVVKN